jgi:hypothetical protein
MTSRNCKICPMAPETREHILRCWMEGTSLRTLDANLNLPHGSVRYHLTTCEARSLCEAQADFVPTEARRLLEEMIAADRAVITSIEVAAARGQNLAVERLLTDYTKRTAARLTLIQYVADYQDAHAHEGGQSDG